MDVRRVSLATGIEVSLLEAGTGGRPLLLIHGFTGAKEDFADHADVLAADGWHVVAPDLRGHGASDQPAGLYAYTLKTFATDVLAVADALGWDRFALLGHSMGGMVVQVAALEAPERLVGLVLMDTTHGPLGGIDPDGIELGKSVVEQGGMAALVEAQRDRAGDLATAADQRLRETRPGYIEFGENKSRACSGDMWRAMIDEIVFTQPDRLADLAGLAVPTLVIVGEQDQPFLSHADAMAATIPSVQRATISDAGHSPQFENPDEWYGVLSSFLAGLPTD